MTTLVPLRTARTNIRQVFERATPEALNEGLAWYEDAADWCSALGKLETVAGITAALSPMVSWPTNQAAAKALIEGEQVERYGVFGSNIIKAWRILDGARPLDVLGGPKVRAFYQAIVERAAWCEAVIDRHALAVYLGRPATEAERHGISRRTREAAQLAYREEADAQGILAIELQAVTWVQWRAEQNG